MNSNLQNKLSRFEATPPLGVWDKIAEALENDNDFTQRLYHYQEIPKTNLWNKIETSLNKVTPAKVVPFTTRYNKPIRYIAAAGIIAVIMVSVSLLMKKTEAGPAETAQGKLIPATDVTIQKPVTTSTVNTTTKVATATSLPGNTKPDALDDNNRQRRFLDFINPQNVFSAIVLKGNFVPAPVAQNKLLSLSAINDYMVYSDDDGNAMKVPKKLFSLVSCPQGDGSCKERILIMQQKLSSASIAPDFTGVLEMLRQLQ